MFYNFIDFFFLFQNYQTDIDHLLGPLLNLESVDEITNVASMHLEKLHNVYFKLRSDFYDIFR